MVRWKAIPNYPGYRVGSDGSVWSQRVTGRRGRGGITKDTPWKSLVLSPHGSTKRYRSVMLRQNGRSFRHLVHNLLLLAFRGPRPEGYWGCHRNDIGHDNRLSNLRWGTPKSNGRDKIRNGRQSRGEQHFGAILTEALVMEIRRDEVSTNAQLSAKYNIQRSTIYAARHGRTWKHLPMS